MGIVCEKCGRRLEEAIYCLQCEPAGFQDVLLRQAEEALEGAVRLLNEIAAGWAISRPSADYWSRRTYTSLEAIRKHREER